jgi:hypothetical protein
MEVLGPSVELLTKQIQNGGVSLFHISRFFPLFQLYRVINHHILVFYGGGTVC